MADGEVRRGVSEGLRRGRRRDRGIGKVLFFLQRGAFAPGLGLPDSCRGVQELRSEKLSTGNSHGINKEKRSKKERTATATATTTADDDDFNSTLRKGNFCLDKGVHLTPVIKDLLVGTLSRLFSIVL